MQLGDLSLTPRIHMVDGESQRADFCNLPSDLQESTHINRYKETNDIID